MINHIRFAYIIAWVSSALLSLIFFLATYVFLVNQDSWGPEGFTSGVSVTELPSTLSTEEFLNELSAVAQEQNINIYKTSVSLANDARSTDYYLISGNPETVIGNLDTEFFPTFSDKYPSHFYPKEQLSRNQITGTYLIDGNPSNTHAVLNALNQLGVISTSIQSKPDYILWAFFLIGNGWGIAIAILLVCLILSLCQLQSARLTIVSARVTAGEASLHVSLREIAALLMPAYSPLALSGITLALYSLIFAAGYRLATIGGIFFQQAILVTGALSISILSTYIYTARYSIGELNKGRRPLPLLRVLSGVLVFIAFLGSAANISTTLILKIEDVKESYADGLRNEHADLVQPVLGHALLSSQADVAKEQLGNVFAQLEADQASYLISKNPLYNSPSSASDNIILANPNYMRTFTQLDSSLLDKVASTAQEESTIAVVIPQKYSQHETEIITQVKSWADYQQEWGKTPHPTTNIKTYTNIDTGILPLLNYNLPTNMYVENPVIIVVHSSNHVIPPQIIGDYGVVFKDTTFKKSVNEANLGYAVIGYEHTTQNSALAAVDRKIAFRVSLLGSSVAILTLLLGSIILATNYHARNRSAIFLLSTSGASFTEIYGNFIMKNFLLATIPISLITITTTLPLSVIFTIAAPLIIASTSAVVITLKKLENTLSRFALEIS